MRTDFLKDPTNGDLLTQNGDFAFGPSDMQHITDLIVSFPGYWMEYPSVGVGLFQYFNSAGQEQALTQSISVQLASDGYSSQPVSIYNPDGTYTVYPNAFIPA